MKKLLFVMVMALLASCGKDNKVSSAAAPVPAPAPAPVVVVASTNAITINDPNGIQLGGLIDSYATSFGIGRATYYESYNQVVVRAPNTSYMYTVVPTGVSFTYNLCFGSSCRTNSTVSRTVIHSSVVVADKIKELKAIINSSAAGSVYKFSNTIFYVTNASTRVKYKFDLELPIQANPTAIQQVNGEVENFYKAE